MEDSDEKKLLKKAMRGEEISIQDEGKKVVVGRGDTILKLHLDFDLFQKFAFFTPVFNQRVLLAILGFFIFKNFPFWPPPPHQRTFTQRAAKRTRESDKETTSADNAVLGMVFGKKKKT